MAKSKQPSAKAEDTIEGDGVKNRTQPEKLRPHLVSVKPSGPIFALALAAFVLSFIALGFATFAVWQNSQRPKNEPLKSEVDASNIVASEAIKNRFATLEATLAAYENSQKKAIAALSQRLDRQADVTPLPDFRDTEKFISNDTTQATARIDQRFAALEIAVKSLAAAATGKPVDAISSNSPAGGVAEQTRLDFGVNPDQVSLLIASGLLADNIVGASLDRWISLLQGMVDRGSIIPGLAELRIAANPTPERPLSLIRTAHGLVPQMTQALNQASDDAGFLEKTGAKLGQLIRLREIGDGAEGNEAVLHAFETALSIQDLEGMSRAAGQWSGPDVPSLKNWIAAAQRRHSLDRAVNALVTDRLANVIAVQ